MRFAAWSALVIGTTMLAQWVFFIVAGQVPEFETEPIAIVFHLVAEFATAGALLVSGILLLRRARHAVELALVAFGMLVYTSVNAPGYFAQLGEWPLVAMFGVVLAVAVGAIGRLLAGRVDT